MSASLSAACILDERGGLSVFVVPRCFPKIDSRRGGVVPDFSRSK